MLPEQSDQPPLSGSKQLIDDSDVLETSEGPKRTETSEDEEEDESEELQDQEDVEVRHTFATPSHFPIIIKQVYNQIAQIPAGTARKDALRLTKKKAKSLPRVTAYCTAG